MYNNYLLLYKDISNLEVYYTNNQYNIKIKYIDNQYIVIHNKKKLMFGDIMELDEHQITFIYDTIHVISEFIREIYKK
jgi:hypothetical protein